MSARMVPVYSSSKRACLIKSGFRYVLRSRMYAWIPCPVDRQHWSHVQV